MVDVKKIEEAIKMLLEATGEDVNREGLIETPNRVARMYEEILSGYEDDARNHLKKIFKESSTDMVLQKDISFHSLCEHHLAPFFGKVHVAYIPNGFVVGLSKLARAVETFSKRLQLQERLTKDIAKAINENLKPKGVMVIIEAEHTCMTMRGVKKVGSKTVTYFCVGEFEKNENLQNRVFNLIK